MRYWLSRNSTRPVRREGEGGREGGREEVGEGGKEGEREGESQ